jgi:hypothetical protein
MDTPSDAYLKRALTWLAGTTAVYLLMNGSQIFETLLIVPVWTTAPPASLTMFQGDYRLDFKAFWIAFHTLHELTFILALVFCWRLKSIRSWLLKLLVAHIAVRAWTIAYFAPTIIEFQGLPSSSTIDPVLIERAARWRLLNLLRVAVFLAVNLGLFPLVVRVAKMPCAAKPAHPVNADRLDFVRS